MRQRDVLNFRTPQHQSFGTNKWGGASPLLARDIPKESLDQRYVRLNTVQEGGRLFLPTTVEEAIFGSPPPTTIGDEVFNTSKHEFLATASQKGLLRKLVWQPQRRSATLGLKPRYKWLPKLKFKKKWPNGWC